MKGRLTDLCTLIQRIKEDCGFSRASQVAQWEGIHLPMPRDAGDTGSIPGLGKSPGGENGNPFQYSFLEKLHGQRSLVGCISRGHKGSDTTEYLSTSTVVSVLY